jgi:DivIVA domain-containing protein
MDMSPQTVRSTGFKLVKKGYDPDEVEAFKEHVTSAVEFSQNQATAMEARARAAVAKLQEVSQQVANAPAPAAAAPSSGDTEVISRTLLLAQRTADSAVADARAEADSIVTHARDEAGRVLDNARAAASKTVEEARIEARRTSSDERARADNEVQALLARRDFLLADVDHLEQYIQAQRERLRDASVQLLELVDRVPGGLGDMRRPLLSASAHSEPATSETGPAPAAQPAPSAPPAQRARDDQEGQESQEGTEPVAAPALELGFEGDPDGDLDPSPLFMPAPGRPPQIASMALSSDADTKESVWRMLDEEVAHTQAAQGTFADVTSEVPAVPAPVDEHDPFRITGDELQ